MTDYDFPSKQGLVATFSLVPKDEWDWENRVKINNDPYGKRIITYAADAAWLAEQLMDADPDLPFNEVMDKAFKEADYDGITGFMYGAAVQELSKAWVHGEKVRNWHNASYGQEDAKGVINPAILVVGTDD